MPDAGCAAPILATQSVLPPYPVGDRAVDVVAAEPCVAIGGHHLPSPLTGLGTMRMRAVYTNCQEHTNRTGEHAPEPAENRNMSGQLKP